jgi:hypothetical protein
VQGDLAYVVESFEEGSVALLMSHCCVQQTIQRNPTAWDVPKEAKDQAFEFFVGGARG